MKETPALSSFIKTSRLEDKGYEYTRSYTRVSLCAKEKWAIFVSFELVNDI